MNETRIDFNHVWKRFRRGSESSLRDVVPALARRLVGRRRKELRRQEFWALQDVSFTVRRGEALGIIGPNGAGKSTILKLLAGILRPNRGSVTVQGRVSALIEVAAGFHPDLTGRENVYLNASILGMTRREIDRKYDDIVAFAGIQDFMDTPVKRYSSGMYARLGFSVAAHMEPDVLLVDEVLSVGDMAFRAKCFERMRQFLAGDTTVVFVSHDLRAVSWLCDRTLLLAGGLPVHLGETAGGIRQYSEAWTKQKETTAGRAEEVIIESAELVDASGRPGASFAPGEAAAFRLVLRFDVPADDLTVGCFVRNERQALMLDTTSTMLGCEMLSGAAGTRARLTFDLALNLISGVYQIGANVYDVTRRRYLDYRDGLATFVVESDPRAQGGEAYLAPACTIAAFSHQPSAGGGRPLTAER